MTVCAQRAVDLSRAAGSRHRLLDALYKLGSASPRRAALTQARSLAEEMAALEAAGDPPRLRAQRLI